MAIDCDDVPTNVSYSSEIPWGSGCISRDGFQLDTLWKYTQSIQAACPSDERLYLQDEQVAGPQRASLTQAACEVIAGKGWTYYPTSDIWNRLTMWKFPLLQLVASFPRPPLSFTIESLVILHLLGDPIDTIKNLLFKLTTCEQLAQFWESECKAILEPSTRGREGEDFYLEDRDWKALTMVTDAYSEWHEADAATDILHGALSSLKHAPDVQDKITEAARITARALAADRSTKLLPIIVAETLFIGAIAVALGKSASGAKKASSSDTVFINVEAHSTAFSALYFWILPAVFLGALIGVSQTENAIPRILKRFQVDLDRLLVLDQHKPLDPTLDGIRLALPRKIESLNQCLTKDDARTYHGGVYSWQPSKWQPKKTAVPTRTLGASSEPASSLQISAALLQMMKRCRTHNVLPYAALIIATLTGVIISSLVPPAGFTDCRRITETLMGITWVISALSDVALIHVFPLTADNARWLFWSTFIKDLLVTVATVIGGIVVTVFGVFNRCSCYTNWGRTGLALPQRADLAELLEYRLDNVYPAILFVSIGIELLLIPLFICLRYRYAFRVFIQRDDRTSNAPWLWKLHRRGKALRLSLPRLNTLHFFPRPTLHRSMTSGERGMSGGSTELQRLTLAQTSSAEEADPQDRQGRPTVSLPEIPIHTSSWGVDLAAGSGIDNFVPQEPRRRDT
ncbi:MAG: hypothetical protein Q9174_004600 [Haloplaca sp. 1 TL-2023]